LSPIEKDLFDMNKILFLCVNFKNNFAQKITQHTVKPSRGLNFQRKFFFSLST